MLRIILNICLISFMGFGSAYGITVSDIINNVKQKEKETENMVADLVETIVNKDTKITQSFEGKITLKKPNKIYAEFTKPMNQKIFCDGKAIWIYMQDFKQAIQQNISGNDVSDPILSVGKMFETFQKNYDITLEGNEIVESSDTYLLGFTPKRGNESMPKMKVSIDKKTWLPVKTDIVEMEGSIISIVFKNIKTNTNISDRIFEFKPPKDAEVITNPINIPAQ